MLQNTHLANTDESLVDVSTECLWQIVCLSNKRVDKVELRCEALEQEVAAGCICVRLHVELREVRLHQGRD